VKSDRKGWFMFAHAAGVAMVALVLTATSANAAPLINEDFQSPMYSVRTADPSFTGWSWNNAPMVKTARPDYRSDAPGDPTNQSIQFEWDNAEANHTVTAPIWSTGDVFTLTLDVAPQSWNGANDRYIAPSLIQGGTTIWDANTLMDKWSGSPVWEQKEYIVPTTGFTSGSDVTLKIDHTGQRGIYVDNVNLAVDAPPADNDPPLPNPPTWDTAPTVFDYTSVFMSVNPASDPFGVEYLFTNTTNSNDSGWQDSTEWVDSGLNQNASYDYQAIARDKSPNQNPTSAATDSATTGGLDGLIFSSGFQFPKYPNGTANPDFVGWEWTSAPSVRARTAANQSDVPVDVAGDNSNQLMQFEYTDDTATRDTSHPWAADEVYTLTLNASPQSWNGTQQRFITPSLLQTDGTELWSETVELPIYDDFGRNPWTDAQTFEFEIDASTFTAGTEGQPLSVKMVSSGFRGMYFDNVMLTFAGSQTAVPEPSTFALAALGLLGLGWYGRRRRLS